MIVESCGSALAARFDSVVAELAERITPLTPDSPDHDESRE
jgi:hypothetical protein